MRPLNTLTDAQPGQEIRFLYRGGSTPHTPGYRNVKVDKVEDGRVHGYDLNQPEDNNYRQYKPDNAQAVQVVEEAPVPVPAEVACDCESPCLPEIADDPSVRDMMRMLGLPVSDEGPMEETRVNFVKARQEIVDAINEAEGEDLAYYYLNIMSNLRSARVAFDAETGELVIRMPERKVVGEIDARIGDKTLHIEMDNRGQQTVLRNGEEVPNADVPEIVAELGGAGIAGIFGG